MLVSSLSNYKKQSQFKALSSYSASLAHATVIRDGKRQQVQNTDILVGDVLVLSTGDLVPADGVIIKGHALETDESSLTGESDTIKKSDRNPFILSGTKVVNGTGEILVTCVGTHSLNGKTLLSLSLESEDTPLQKKLSRLTDLIAKFGIGASLFMVLILIVAYFTVVPLDQRPKADIADDIIDILIAAVTLIVVAIPEGLPMAVTLALVGFILQFVCVSDLARATPWLKC